MTDLLWPGDHRAGDLFTDDAFLAAMVAVESAWLAALVDHGLAPGPARDDLDGLVDADDLPELAERAEAGGNPVIAFLALLRERVAARTPEAARWLHRGLTSQDVLDTALVLCTRDAVERVDADLRRQLELLVRLADDHRSTEMVGRTLTQHAVPVSFGLKAAGWLAGVTDAARGVRAARAELKVQVGGAAGSLAASTELAALRGLADAPRLSLELGDDLATRLDLVPATPWHTTRSAITRIGDALVSSTDAWGRVASDVATLARPEIGELHEAAGGGSSTMPQKQNPVLSVLLRRAAITAPGLGATLHTAVALAVDERPDGAWHAEWATLRTLGRRTVVAASQATELLTGLRVDAQAMADRVRTADGVLAEQRSIAALVDAEPRDAYRGATDPIIDAAIAGATTFLEETS